MTHKSRPALSGILALAIAGAPLGLGLAGCEQLPGDEREQGTAIGAGGGALAGAVLAGEDNRGVGALIGGLLGAGGGYLIGTQLDKDEEEAREAAQEARQDPATAADVQGSNSADLDGNGFVTLDEVSAMAEAGLSDEEMVDRLQATDQVFQLNESQEQQLRDAGVSSDVIAALPEINREQLARYREENSDRISQPRDQQDDSDDLLDDN